MSCCLPIQGAPVAAPFARSQERARALPGGAFSQITPGALAAVSLPLSRPAGGRT
jgi:hypothetical protein